MESCVLLLRTCVLIGTLSTTAMAQAQEPASINYGGFRITPTVDTELAYIDNVTFVPESSEVIDSFQFVIRPEVEIYTENSFSEQRIHYRLEDARYYSSPEDNYTDQLLSYNVKLRFSDFQGIRFGAQHLEGHDARGRGFTAGRPTVIRTTDNYSDSNVNGAYILGARRAPFYAVGSVSVRNLNYDLDTAPLFNRDRQEVSGGIVLRYRLSSVTSFALDVKRTDITYDADTRDSISLDSTRDSILIGMDWDASAFLSGEAKIGYEERDFESALREDFNGVDWYVDMTWRPISNTALTLLSDFDTRENNALGDFIDTTTTRLKWMHNWLERLSTSMEFGYVSQDYQGLDNEIDYRKDSTAIANLQIDYQFRRWLHVSTFLKYSSRSSNLEIIEFDRQVLGLMFKVTL